MNSLNIYDENNVSKGLLAIAKELGLIDDE